MSGVTPCDLDVYESGIAVAIVHDPGGAAAIDAWVLLIRRESGQRVDWHYVGGRGVVKVIGDVDAVRTVLRAHGNLIKQMVET